MLKIHYISCGSVYYCLPSEFSLEQHQESKLVHVPGSRAFVSHQVQGAGNMGVAVITEQVVLGKDKQLVISLRRRHLRPGASHCPIPHPFPSPYHPVHILLKGLVHPSL